MRINNKIMMWGGGIQSNHTLSTSREKESKINKNFWDQFWVENSTCGHIVRPHFR